MFFYVKRFLSYLYYIYTSVDAREDNPHALKTTRRHLLILLPDNAGHYVTVRGRVVALEHADQLARKYTGQPYPALPKGQVRVVIKILPERVSGQ